MLHLLSFFLAYVTLKRIVPNRDIECPGDIISYNCSFESNNEMLHLTWRVSIPGEPSMTFTHLNTSSLSPSLIRLNKYITTSLTQYIEDEYIESTLDITVEASTNNSTIECLMGSLGNASLLVEINLSSKYCMANLIITCFFFQAQPPYQVEKLLDAV